jgi:hypothetical protein
LKTYLFIQYKRFCRISFKKGMHPLISGLLISIIFFSLSVLIFSKIAFPMYAYCLVGIAFIARISSKKRVEFLERCFKENEFYRIRILENGILALPFVCFLIYKNETLLSIGLLLSSFILTLLPVRAKFNITIPTPFGKFPFEFTRGFRRFFLLHFVAYFVTYFAIESNNFNLSIFILLITFLISAVYYSFVEPLYFLWIYNHNPKLFIRHKLRTIFMYSLVLELPIAISLFIFFPAQYWITLIALLIGISYVALFMLMKYVSYPFGVTFADELIVAACVLYPPLILVVAPLFYYRSVKTLSKFLHD